MVSWKTAAADSCETETASALEQLLERQPRGWAFVVVEHEAGGSFVQFGDEAGGVFIDLPTSGLSAVRAERAAILFAEAGVREPVDIEATNPDTQEVFMVQSYQLAFGADPARAARFGCRVMREVYRVLDSEPLLIMEGDW